MILYTFRQAPRQIMHASIRCAAVDHFQCFPRTLVRFTTTR